MVKQYTSPMVCLTTPSHCCLSHHTSNSLIQNYERLVRVSKSAALLNDLVDQRVPGVDCFTALVTTIREVQRHGLVWRGGRHCGSGVKI